MKKKNIVYFNYKKDHNTSCKCKSGHIHDSRAEARYCDQLLLEKKAGLIKDYETQKTFRLVVNGETITSHRVDFLVTNNDGSQAVFEYKGFAQESWKIKMNLFKACYPEIPYIVVTGKNN